MSVCSLKCNEGYCDLPFTGLVMYSATTIVQLTAFAYEVVYGDSKMGCDTSKNVVYFSGACSILLQTAVLSSVCFFNYCDSCKVANNPSIRDSWGANSVRTSKNTPNITIGVTLSALTLSVICIVAARLICT